MTRPRNYSHIIFITILVCASFLLADCTGSDLGDVIQAHTPNRIQQTLRKEKEASFRKALSLSGVESPSVTPPPPVTPQ